MGDTKNVIRRVRGNNVKVAFKFAEFANVNDQDTKKTTKVKIIRVTKNPANKDYTRRGVVTKGSILETELGLAKVVSRPGQDGIVNAVIIKQ